MPEFRELFIMTLMLTYILLMRLGLAFGVDAMNLISLWVDATNPEVKAEAQREVDESSLTPAELLLRSRILARLPYKLSAGSKLTRGSSCEKGRSFVWPSGLDDLSSLCLQGLSFTARCVVLNFGSRILTVRLINHTSVQVYRKKKWELALREIPAVASARQFKIALALEFPTFVIAFLSADLVYEPHWYTSMDEMRQREPAAISAYPARIPQTAEEFAPRLTKGFRHPSLHATDYEIVYTNWISERRRNRRLKRDDPAVLVIRKFEHIFPGQGVYSSCELLGRAGISPTITEFELFECPSRASRLFEINYSFILDCQANLFDAVRPALHDTILAPTVKQRKRLGADYFAVFGKCRTRVTQRMSQLQAMYLEDIRKGVPARYDVFEPLFMATAFEKDIHLGHLIFGAELFPLTGLNESRVNDGPLYKLYEAAGLLNSPTYLCDSLYTPALPQQRLAVASPIRLYAFRIPTNPKPKKTSRSPDTADDAPASSGTRKRKHGASSTLAACKRPRKSAPALKQPVLDADDVDEVQIDTATSLEDPARFVRGVVWSFVPPQPHEITRRARPFHMLSEDDMKAACFDTVVSTTKQVVVGPLEWFGNGTIVVNGKRIIVGTCPVDPDAFSSDRYNLIIRQIRARERRRFESQNPRKAKSVLPPSVTTRIRQEISQQANVRSALEPIVNQPSPPASSSSTAVSSRRRVHADAQLAATSQTPLPRLRIQAHPVSHVPGNHAPLAPVAEDINDENSDENSVPAQALDEFDAELADVALAPLDSLPMRHAVYDSTGRGLWLGDGEDVDEEDMYSEDEFETE